MSYEGYTEYLCARGHRWTANYDVLSIECLDCGAPAVWSNEVDQTNGMSSDEPWSMPYPLTVLEPAKVEYCNLGHRHEIEPTRYVIPTLTPEETALADMLSAAMQKSLSAAWARSFATGVQKADRWVRRERNAIAHGKDN